MLSEIADKSYKSFCFNNLNYQYNRRVTTIMKKNFIIFAFLILISCGKAENANQNIQSGIKDQKIIKPEESTVKERYEMPKGYT